VERGENGVRARKAFDCMTEFVALLAAAERLEQELRKTFPLTMDWCAYCDGANGHHREPCEGRLKREAADTLSRLRAALGQAEEALASHAIQCPQCHAAVVDVVCAEFRQSLPAVNEIVSTPPPVSQE
jgi:hypothetical protein